MMTPCYFSPVASLEAERILAQHGESFSLLGSGHGAEYLYYTHDLSRTLMSLTESAWDVCRVHGERWLHKSIQPMLTDHPCNEVLLMDDAYLNPNVIQNLFVEIWDDEGERVTLEVWRRLVRLHEEPIGVVGMAKRAMAPRVACAMNTDSIHQRVGSLTRREREVIELVIQGDLNKTIARKLEIAIRTVEARRSKAMAKLNVTRVAELVRLWIAAGEQQPS